MSRVPVALHPCEQLVLLGADFHFVLLDFCHSDRWIMLSCCYFNLQFPGYNNVKKFHMLLCLICSMVYIGAHTHINREGGKIRETFREKRDSSLVEYSFSLFIHYLIGKVIIL